MDDQIQCQHTSMHRYAIRFEPAVIRDSIPDGMGGAYILAVGPHPIYVGRSDQRLRKRLLTHGLRHIATHFLWRLTKSYVEAYHLECAWYHGLEHLPYLRNLMHPSQPAGSEIKCSFCEIADIAALRYAMGVDESTKLNESCPLTRCVREIFTTVSAEQSLAGAKT